MNDEEIELGDAACPFCESTDSCRHLLLLVDKTFRRADGGVLMNSFNNRWSKIVERSEDNTFEEREAFDVLLEEVDRVAEVAIEAASEDGPGMSSAYILYFASSQAAYDQAVARFAGVED